MDSKRHLLVPVDGTKASVKACEWVVGNFYRDGDEVVLFHTVPPGQYLIMSTDLGLEQVVITDDEETQRKVEEMARKMLNDNYIPMFEEKKVTHSVEVIHCATDNDSIGAVICKRAEQLQAAVIVMAKHNKGALKEFFVGSATNYVTHHAVCPVLVMHMG
jgi:nucleotide-binding universal stress UspA family protein